MADLCPYPFQYQMLFDGDAVRARTAKGLDVLPVSCSIRDFRLVRPRHHRQGSVFGW